MVVAVIEYKLARLLRTFIIHNIDSVYFVADVGQHVQDMLFYAIAWYDNYDSIMLRHDLTWRP
jgi:hypothetical protein